MRGTQGPPPQLKDSSWLRDNPPFRLETCTAQRALFTQRLCSGIPGELVTALLGILALSQT